MKNLSIAVSIAGEAFKGVLDKGGSPYVLHCIRVMLAVKDEPEYVQVAAVLHDLIEDCPEWNYKRLIEEGISSEAITLLGLLTHKKGTPYMDYIKSISTDPYATKIKMADLEDNSNITRLKGLTKKDLDRMEKYFLAYTYLSKL